MEKGGAYKIYITSKQDVKKREGKSCEDTSYVLTGVSLEDRHP